MELDTTRITGGTDCRLYRDMDTVIFTDCRMYRDMDTVTHTQGE